MRVGYVGELNIKGIGSSDYNDWISILSEKAREEKLDYLILCGGISDNFKISTSFVESLNKALSFEKIRLKFISGNTDFYYDDRDIVDKETKFFETLKVFRNDTCYFPKSSIFSNGISINGIESWYDYSLYRGKPADLRDITRKSLLWYRNRDNDYITGKDDYMLGYNNLFDIRYTNSCLDDMDLKLKNEFRKHGKTVYNIVVMYFYPIKAMLSEGFINRYSGTFSGSSKFFEVMKDNNVTDCVVGKSCNKGTLRVDGIRIHCLNRGEVNVFEYSI